MRLRYLPFMTSADPWIAVVDDDASIRRVLMRMARLAGIHAQAFDSGIKFLEAIQQSKPACVVLDLHMPGMTGFDVQARLAQVAPDAQVIIMTAQDSPEIRNRAMLGKPFAYLTKPMKYELLLKTIEQAMNRIR